MITGSLLDVSPVNVPLGTAVYTPSDSSLVATVNVRTPLTFTPLIFAIDPVSTIIVFVIGGGSSSSDCEIRVS